MEGRGGCLYAVKASQWYENDAHHLWFPGIRGKYAKKLVQRWRKGTGNWLFWLGTETINRRAMGQTSYHAANAKSSTQSQQMLGSEEQRLWGQICYPSAGMFHLTAHCRRVKGGFVYLLSNRNWCLGTGRLSLPWGPRKDNLPTDSVCTGQQTGSTWFKHRLWAISLRLVLLKWRATEWTQVGNLCLELCLQFPGFQLSKVKMAFLKSTLGLTLKTTQYRNWNFSMTGSYSMPSLNIAFKCHLNKMEHCLIFLACDTKGHQAIWEHWWSQARQEEFFQHLCRLLGIQGAIIQITALQEWATRGKQVPTRPCLGLSNVLTSTACTQSILVKTLTRGTFRRRVLNSFREIT